MEVKVDITEMVKECINEELCDTIGNVNELRNETYSINSRLEGKADVSMVSINDQRIGYLEEQIRPTNMFETMFQDYKQLEAYRAIGTPYSIGRDLDILTRQRDDYSAQCKDWQEKYKIIYNEKLDIQSKSIYFEELRDLLCDMMNNYDNCTAGLANADTGTARFFYINALSNVMTKIVEMEKNKNGYC